MDSQLHNTLSTEELLKLLAVIGAIYLLPRADAMLAVPSGACHATLFYVATLGFRYTQHAPFGTAVHRDPDVAAICATLNRGRCCRYSDILFWRKRRVGKEWSLTEREEAHRTPRLCPNTPRIASLKDLYDEELTENYAL